MAKAIIQFWLEAGILDTWETDHKTYFTFRHLTFQEYAVAVYLNQMWQPNPDDTWPEIKHHLYHYTWHETFLLLAGVMEEKPLQDFINRLLQASKPYQHPEDFFETHKFIGAILAFPVALILFPIALIFIALVLPSAIAIRLLQGDKSKSQAHFTNRYIYAFQESVNDVTNDIKKWKEQWKEEWKEQFANNKPKALLSLLQLVLAPVVLVPVIFWQSFRLAGIPSKGGINKVINYYRHLMWSDKKSLKKAILAATQPEVLLAAQLIGENPTKVSQKTAEVVAQRLAELIRSDIPSLARTAAEAAAGVSEGVAGRVMLNMLVQDIYMGSYRGGDYDEHKSFGMPISGRVLLQQARQKRMSLDTVYALLSEMKRVEQEEQTISEKHQIMHYVYLARYLLLTLNTRRFRNDGKGRYWILEILGYYDGEPPAELVQIVSDVVERRHATESPKSDFTAHLAQRLVRWEKATPAALAVLASKIYEGKSSKELLDTVAYGFSTGQISGDIAERLIWCVVRWSDRQEEEGIKAIFTAVLGPNQPYSDVARIAVLIAIEALDSKNILGYTERGPFYLITSIMPQILASERVTDAAFDALAEGLAHHVTYVRTTATKILHEALQAEPNLNTAQFLRFLLKILDNDERQVRLLAATAIKDAIKANIIGGELIGDLEPSGYNYEDAISELQSYYRSRLDSALRLTTPTRNSSKDREDIHAPIVKAEALCQKLWSIDKTNSSDRESWQNILTNLESVARLGYIQVEWLESFTILYDDISQRSLEDEKLISGLPGYESVDKFISQLVYTGSDKYGQKWTDYFSIARNVRDARSQMSPIVLILANAALNDVLNDTSVKFLLREDIVAFFPHKTFRIKVYGKIAKHGFASSELVEKLLEFLQKPSSYPRNSWEGATNPAVIYALGQVYSGNPEFREQVLLAINQAILRRSYVDMVIKIITEQLIPASELAPAILESFDTSERISETQTQLLGQLSTQYPVTAKYVRKIIDYISREATPWERVRYLDGLGLIIQQESCEREAFHLIVSRLLYDLGSNYDEFRQPVTDILVVAHIVQPEEIDQLFTVLSRKNSGHPDQNWLDAAQSIGNILNAQENQEKCLLSTFYYLLDDPDDWLKETIVQLLGFVDFQANTNFLLNILRNQTTVGQRKDIRVKVVFALTQIGYRHQDRQERIIKAFHEIFFEENHSLPTNDTPEFFDRENISLKMAMVTAIGNLQNSSVSARKILLKALEYRLNRNSLGPDLLTSAAEALLNIKLEPYMSEEITKLLISLSNPNDQTRDAAWKALNTLDIETIVPTNR